MNPPTIKHFGAAMMGMAIGWHFCHAQGLTLPENDPLIQGDIGGAGQPEITAAELANPPAGAIQKIHLRVVNASSRALAGILATVPAGPDGKSSPGYSQSQSYKTGLDLVAASRLQTDCFALVPQIADLLKARQADVPDFAFKVSGLASGFSTVLINAIERHIIDKNASVSEPYLALFIKAFSVAGFKSEGDWESSPIPIDSAGLMILDPAAVVTQLKARPWQEAGQFLGNNTSAEAFARYGTSGNGMAVLKSKFLANQVAVTAKWNELATWVAQQKPAGR